MEAFQLSTTAQPDLIIMDMLLPDSNGLIVLEWLKSNADTASVPVIMLTVVDNDGQGHALGATDYLYEPLEASDLLQRIATIFADRT